METKRKSIFRRDKKRYRFVQIDAEAIENSQLSWKAKGILTYILSKPDTWEVYLSDIVKHSTDKKDSVNSGLLELIENGYITRTERRNAKGQKNGYEYTTADYPLRINRDGKSDPNYIELSNIERSNNINYINSQSAEKMQMAYSSFSFSVFELFIEKYNNFFVNNHPYYRKELLSECLFDIDCNVSELDIDELKYWETIIGTYLSEWHDKNTDCYFRLFTTGETIKNYYNRLLL